MMNPTRSKRSPLLSGAVIATTTILALSACSSGTSPSADSDGEIEPVLRSPAGTEAVESITWNMTSGEPDTLNPPNVPTYSGLALVANLCDSLLTVDENGDTVPGLTEVEIESPTRIVFTLRSAANFWDGSPVTADDIVFSLNHAASPTSYMAPKYQNVTSIEALSDTEVAVEFSEPDATFLPTMVGAGGAVMQRDFSEAAGESIGTPGTGLMCSGPFKLDNWQPGSGIQISKNEDYWDADRQPLVNEVNFTFVNDTSALTQALTTGEIDGGWEIPTSAVPALSNSDTGALFFGDTTSVWSLRVANPESPLASEEALRQAFHHLIDREAVARVVFHQAAAPWASAISANSWPSSVQDKALDEYEANTANRQYDPELAKQLVSEAGAEGLELEVIVPSGDEVATQLAQLVQDQVASTGMSLSIRSLQPLEYAEAMYDPSVRGSSDLLLSVNGDVVQEPLASIRYFYLPDALYNWDGFVDQEVSDLFASAISELDVEARTDFTFEIQRIVEAHGATVAIVNPYQVNFVNDRLGGVITGSFYTNMPSLTYIGGVSQ